MRVAHRMARDVVSVESEQSCHWALQVMNAADVARLPVLDGNRLVGVVTELDIRRRAPHLAGLVSSSEEDALLLASTHVGGVMRGSPLTIGPEASIADAASVMLARDVSTLCVTDQGRLVGMLTLRDVLRAVSEAVGITSS
jgi:acetoin utilization protein AcuB